MMPNTRNPWKYLMGFSFSFIFDTEALYDFNACRFFFPALCHRTHWIR